MPTDEPATSVFLAVRFRGYQPVVLPPPARQRGGAGWRALLGVVALLIILVLVLALGHVGLRVP